MEVSEPVEKLWRKYCEECDGSYMMSKSSFVYAMHEFNQPPVSGESIEVTKNEVIESNVKQALFSAWLFCKQNPKKDFSDWNRYDEVSTDLIGLIKEVLSIQPVSGGEVEEQFMKRLNDLVNYDLSWAKTEIKALPSVNDGTEHAYFDGFILGANKSRARTKQVFKEMGQSKQGSVDNWISVEVEKPETDTIVLCITEYGKYCTGYFMMGDEWDLSGFDSAKPLNFVTHWQPLPTPPSK